MAESPKFPRLENRGRGTPSGVRDVNLPEAIQFCSQDALLMHYRQITYGFTLISSNHYKNSSVIVDLAMGQIPRSTERISSYCWYVTLRLTSDLWPWTFVLYRLCHGQTPYQIWAQSSNPARSYWDLNIWHLEHVSRVALCSGQFTQSLNSVKLSVHEM